MTIEGAVYYMSIFLGVFSYYCLGVSHKVLTKMRGNSKYANSTAIEALEKTKLTLAWQREQELKLQAAYQNIAHRASQSDKDIRELNAAYQRIAELEQQVTLLSRKSP